MKNISLVILAAGASKRFGDDDKLLAPWRGSPLIAHTLALYKFVAFRNRIAVVRDKASSVAEHCRTSGFDVLENEAADLGIARSIALAAEQCSDADGLMIALGDMPLLKPDTLVSLITEIQHAPPNSIVAPMFGNRRGHPVTFSSPYFSALKALRGDRGAGAIIEKHLSSFVGVPVNDAGIHIDFDDPADFDRP